MSILLAISEALRIRARATNWSSGKNQALHALLYNLLLSTGWMIRSLSEAKSSSKVRGIPQSTRTLKYIFYIPIYTSGLGGKTVSGEILHCKTRTLKSCLKEAALMPLTLVAIIEMRDLIFMLNITWLSMKEKAWPPACLSIVNSGSAY